MAMFFITIPFMILATAIAVVPLLVGISGESRKAHPPLLGASGIGHLNQVELSYADQDAALEEAA